MVVASVSLRPISMALAIILARQLPPRDFGILALAMILFTTANFITDLGLRPVVVQTKEDIKKVAHYAFVIVMTTSITFTILASLLAEPLAQLLGGSIELAAVIRWMSIYVTIDGLLIIPEALLRRDLRFKELSLSHIPGELASALIAIPLAIAGFGVWSLVIGHCAGQFLRAALLWAYYRPWIWLRPQKWDRGIVSGMLRQGMPTMGNGLLKTFQNQIDTFIVGRQLGTTAVGLYSKAFALTTRLADMLTTAVFGNVLFPSYTKMQDDKPRLTRAYLKSTKMVFLIIVPLSIGLAIVAPVLVPVLLGPRWIPMIPLWQIFSLYGLTRPISTNAAPVFLAVGQPRRNMTASIVLLSIMIPLLFLLIPLYGTMGAALAVSIASLGAMLFNVFQVNQILPGTASKSLIQSIPFLVAGGLMGLVVLLIQRSIIDLIGGENVAALFMLIVVGALVYISAIVILQRALVLELYELFIKALGFDRRWPRLLPAHLRTGK
jgi:PST family polysaccharide transporter